MKKNTSLPDDAGAAPSYGYGDGAAMPAPAAANDGLIFDDGEPFALAAAGSGSVSAGSTKPVATIATLADYLINGFWQYNSAIAHHWASNTITYNISGLNAAEQFLAQSALQAWHDVANVTFVQTTGSANITFSDAGTMQAVTNASWYGNGAMASANVDISSDWIANDGGAMDGKTGIDSYGYQTYIHEIGHALGLGHQGPYNGSAVYSTNALYADDTWQYSIMSYFSENNYSGSTYRYVVSPQMADIYAVGQIYGADTTTRTGDTVYGFHSNAGAVYDFSTYTRTPALTIYDSGGNDTLDCSGYSVAQTIDLHAGAFSSIGGLVNNIGIALGTNIETAIGGSGNDTLIANDNGCTLMGGAGNDTLIGGAGNDRLIGGPGVDIMTGGGGANTFVFATGDSSTVAGQHDRITDFKPGIDHIDLSGIDAIASTSGYDQFRFIGMSAFDGSAGELDYFYNSTLCVTVVQGDTNGDRVADFAIDLVGNLTLSLGDFIGAYSIPVVIEAIGATTLTQLGGTYCLYANGTTTGPTLKYGGATVAAGQFGGYAPIGVEQTSTGYEVAWKMAGADLYSVWSTDSSGNYTGNLYQPGSGSNATLEALETSFHQDLNGDGVIGAPPITGTVIEALGSTSLVQNGQNFYLDDISTSTGPQLKFGGVAVVAGQFGGYTPIGVEQTSTGYEVAWKMASADLYSVWSTDSSGNYTGNLYQPGSGSSASLEALETSFHQDLNGDGVIGAPPITGTVIEALGSTSLVQNGQNFYLDNISTGTGLTLKYNGTTVVAGQFGGYTPIGVEQTSTGYEVAWKMVGTDLYSVWSTDSSGNYTGNLYQPGSGSSVSLEALETSFHQDLNGDGVIGVATSAGTLIESAGATSLVQNGQNFYLDNISTGTGPTLKYNGTTVVAGQFGGYTPIGAEQTSTGYEVAWKMAGADLYSVWSTDSSGNYTGNLYQPGPGSGATLEALEASFHQDLNGDGVIGANANLLDPHVGGTASPLIISDWHIV
ncbi:M10 family metallopeptidase C-terminal domain-containing protein [Bradyrhizobium lablabi]|uniref:M10 family metallopeptidase C-terminal domain-containing protein n=1 Tax=Bradyrhizobium lablabi TaxID=722472 RepID=UPI00090C8838|nr:M10 family metallopeptidase C-terminal domain-containing protein [Bradyrhizobium lablabi]SHM81480.1 serralysin [Bradyrhizobium lablabi]